MNTTIVTAGAVVSATRKYSNKDNSERKFDIAADVNIANGTVKEINKGYLFLTDNPTKGRVDFSIGEDINHLSFASNNFTNTEVREAFEAVMDFVEAVIENVNSTEE